MAERSKARTTPGIILPAVKTQMLKEFEAGDDRPWNYVHASELSHQARFCPRSVYHRITGGPLDSGKYDFVRENIFAEGNSIHAKWQTRLRKAVPLWGDWKCLICGKVTRDSVEPPEMVTADSDSWCLYDGGHMWEYDEVTLLALDTHLLGGHADGAFDTTMAEFKSVGTGSVRIEAPSLYNRHLDGSNLNLAGLWKDIQRPFQTHLNQGDIYLWIANQLGLPFTQMSYVYESKWNQMVKEFVVNYSEKRSLLLVDQAKSVKYAVDHGQEPECKFPGKCAECKPYDARTAHAETVVVRRTVEVRG